MKYAIEKGYTILNNRKLGKIDATTWVKTGMATEEEMLSLRVRCDGRIQRLEMNFCHSELDDDEVVFDDYSTPSAYFKEKGEDTPDPDPEMDSVRTIVWWEDVSRTHKAVLISE